jgi:hypothetical protein
VTLPQASLFHHSLCAPCISRCLCNSLVRGDQLRPLKYIIYLIWILEKNLSKNLPVNANARQPVGAPRVSESTGGRISNLEAAAPRFSVADGINAARQGATAAAVVCVKPGRRLNPRAARLTPTPPDSPKLAADCGASIGLVEGERQNRSAWPETKRSQAALPRRAFVDLSGGVECFYTAKS